MSAVLPRYPQYWGFLFYLTLICPLFLVQRTTGNGVCVDAVGKAVADARIVCVEAGERTSESLDDGDTAH